MSTEPAADPQALFTVVKGRPTDEELGAVVAVLTARLDSRRPAAPEPTTSAWSAYWRAVRAPITPGAGAWRASGR